MLKARRNIRRPRSSSNMLPIWQNSRLNKKDPSPCSSNLFRLVNQMRCKKTGCPRTKNCPKRQLRFEPGWRGKSSCLRIALWASLKCKFRLGPGLPPEVYPVEAFNLQPHRQPTHTSQPPTPKPRPTHPHPHPAHPTPQHPNHTHHTWARDRFSFVSCPYTRKKYDWKNNHSFFYFIYL